MKNRHAAKHAEKRYIGEDVVVIGGGTPTRGIVKAVSSNNGHIFLRTEITVGKDTLICTFPAESVVVKEDWMFEAARMRVMSWYSTRDFQYYEDRYLTLATLYGYEPADLYCVLKALNLV